MFWLARKGPINIFPTRTGDVMFTNPQTQAYQRRTKRSNPKVVSLSWRIDDQPTTHKRAADLLITHLDKTLVSNAKDHSIFQHILTPNEFPLPLFEFRVRHSSISWLTRPENELLQFGGKYWKLSGTLIPLHYMKGKDKYVTVGVKRGCRYVNEQIYIKSWLLWSGSALTVEQAVHKNESDRYGERQKISIL